LGTSKGCGVFDPENVDFEKAGWVVEIEGKKPTLKSNAMKNSKGETH